MAKDRNIVKPYKDEWKGQHQNRAEHIRRDNDITKNKLDDALDNLK